MLDWQSPNGQGLLRKGGPPTCAILSPNLVLSQCTHFLKGFHRALSKKQLVFKGLSTKVSLFSESFPRAYFQRAFGELSKFVCACVSPLTTTNCLFSLNRKSQTFATTRPTKALRDSAEVAESQPTPAILGSEKGLQMLHPSSKNAEQLNPKPRNMTRCTTR